MDSPHPFRMSWRIIKRTIIPWLMKIGVTSCPPSRSKIIGKRAANQINRISTSRAASHSDSDESIRVLSKKRSRNGVLPNLKYQGKKTPKHHIAQRYCVLCNKAGITEWKYIPHSSGDCFGKRSDQNSIKDGLEGSLGSRDDATKQYKNSEHKWKKELKALKNQNKMLYSIARKPGSRRVT